MAETSRQKASRPRVSSVASCDLPVSVAADQRPVRWNPSCLCAGANPRPGPRVRNLGNLLSSGKARRRPARAAVPPSIPSRLPS